MGGSRLRLPTRVTVIVIDQLAHCSILQIRKREAWSDTVHGPILRHSAPMTKQANESENVSASGAAVLASMAFLVPLALSASSTPSPNHPRVLSWYLSLKKPWFKPPDWVIPLAWTGIETSLAVAGYRLLRLPSSFERQRAFALLSWNVFMIGGWSRLFFKRRNLAVSTVAAATMIATGVEFARHAKRVDPPAGRAAVPFIVWVSFATVLTATIWGLNRRR
jgi:translocator protein